MSSRYFIRYIMQFGKKGDIVNTFMLLAISVFGYVAIAKVNDSTDILMRLLTGLMATLYLSFMFFVGIMFVKHNVIEKAINRMATFSNATRYSLAAVVVLIIGRLCMGNSALIHIPFTPLIILSLAILLMVNQISFYNCLAIILPICGWCISSLSHTFLMDKSTYYDTLS